MPKRTCIVSFTDAENIRHSVEVSAASAFEAAALGVAEFKRAELMDSSPGPASMISVAVKTPTTQHNIPVVKLNAWLTASAKSPAEQVLKNRLRVMLGK